MLNKLIVTEVIDDGWYLSFDGLTSTNESIQIDEETAKTLLELKSMVVSE